MNFGEFYNDFMQQIEILKDNEDFGWAEQDFFTSVILDYLEDIGEVECPVICPYRAHGQQINAYTFEDGYKSVNLFVSVFYDSGEIQTASKTDIDTAFKRAMQVYRRATNDLFKSFEKNNNIYEFAYSIFEHREEIEKVNVIVLTNGNCKSIFLKNVMIGSTEIVFKIWDMDRLFRCMSSGKMRETIEIDFENLFDKKIPCLENKTSEKYDAYLAIIPGDILASIYAEYGARLLEKNVRSFLQVKGAVNKGIKDTLKNEPDMFLAYNNGISVTAESVIVKRTNGGTMYISKIRDMQIVNGGQTTASIFNTTKDKGTDVDLSNVYVQMKISVINSEVKADEIVHKISEFANTQNKVQMADFSSNDPFNRKMEDLSRVIWTPVVGGEKSINWFFERARGQYIDMLSREGTPARRRIFKELHPLFTKTDMAKYENTWNQMPYFVSEGAQKNFKRFMVGIKERGNFLPDETYYQLIIAKAIMYRKAEKLVQAQQYGGYRANIVTYTLAFISHMSAQRVDLIKIWKEQQLSNALEKEIIRISALVQQYITNPPGNANISEYCKKKDCWNNLLQKEYDISDELRNELISNTISQEVVSSSQKATRFLNEATNEEKELINRIYNIPADVWLSISKWAKDTNNLQPWQRSIAFSVGTMISREKKPSVKQAKQAQIIYEKAKEIGFVEG